MSDKEYIGNSPCGRLYASMDTDERYKYRPMIWVYRGGNSMPFTEIILQKLVDYAREHGFKIK